MKSSYSVVDLFSGCGGASLGVELAGCRVVGAVDIDPAACKIYSRNLGLEPIQGDLRQLKGREILERCGLKKGDTGFVIGCPPCQGFSSLRRTRALPEEDGRNDLISVFLERVYEIQPKVVIFENVPGIATLCGGKYLTSYLNRMRKMGYKSVCETLDTADYGLPQFRKRTVAFSVRHWNDKEEPSMPPASHCNPKYSEERRMLPWSTVRKTISRFPPLEPGESTPSVPNHKAGRHAPRILKIIQNVPRDGGSRKDLPRYLWLKCHKQLRNGGAENVYGRMWWDRPSPTITSRCTCPSSGRFIHPEQDRAITPREAASLQTFPDHFVFPEESSKAAYYIGNAVPPALIRNLVQQFIEDNSHML